MGRSPALLALPTEQTIGLKILDEYECHTLVV